MKNVVSDNCKLNEHAQVFFELIVLLSAKYCSFGMLLHEIHCAIANKYMYFDYHLKV